MRILCRQDTTVVHTHYELVVLGPQMFRIALAELRYGAPKASGAPELVKVFEHAQLSLSPSATRVAVRSAKGLSIVEIASHTMSPSTADALAFLTDELLLSVRPIEDGKPARGLFRGPHGAPPAQIPLPAPLTVQWPEGRGRLWESTVPYQTGELSARSAMYSNGHGHVVIDSEQGLVIRLDKLGNERTVHRVPSEGAHSEVELTAIPTDVGFIVAHGGGRGAGMVNHFAVDGRHLGALPVRGNVSDVCVTDGVALMLRDVDDDSGKLELVVASLPGLEILEVVPTKVLSTYDGYPSIDARDGGREIWLGNGVRLRRFLRSTRGWEDQPMKLDQAPLVEPNVVAASAAKATVAAKAEPAVAAVAASRNVVHPKFGVGKVVAEEGAGEQRKLKIEFADGTRTLLARFVRDE